MPTSIAIVIASAAMGVIITVYGVIADIGILAGVGLADAFTSLIFIPVIAVHSKKRHRISARRDALLVWQYASYEAEEIAAREAKKIRRTSRGLSVLASISLMVIFAPFTIILENPETKKLLLYIGMIAALLPFTSLYIAPAVTVRQIKKAPTVTIIGRDYILLNNRYIGINDRAELTLVEAEVKKSALVEDEGKRSALFVTYTFRMKYGNIMHFTVEVPIPNGRQAEATEFAGRLNAGRAG
jgi:hypothetical protein